MADINIGRALSGLGAAFKNEMPAFMQQVRQEDLDAEKRAEREMVLAERRKKTMFQDAYTAGSLLKAGDYAGIADLMQDRIEILRNTNADPSHSIKKLQLAFLASTGDEGAVSELTRLLGNEISVGVQKGLITLPALPSIVSASDIDEFGNITTRNPSGGGFTTTSTLSEGAEPRISGDSLKNNMDYRKEFNGLQSVKDYANRRGALGIIESSASEPSAAGDLSLIFAYMRMLDPGSVVRESEFQLAASAGSLPTVIQAAYEQLKTGQRLTDIQRTDFTTRAETIYKRATEEFGQLYDNYSSRAERLGLEPRNALVDYRFQSPEEINSQLESLQSPAPSEFTSEEWNALTPSEQDQARSFLIQRQQDRQDY
tara:strand:+ start:41 stop:1153 length:1113 start_codon:yes stop_codon:yes gene_type:complete